MEPVWVVVADSAGAQLLEARCLLQPPTVVEVLENTDERGQQHFARDIALRLNGALQAGCFAHLVIIVAPDFLHDLRDALGKELGRRVISSQANDMCKEHDLPKRVQRVVRDAIQYAV